MFYLRKEWKYTIVDVEIKCCLRLKWNGILGENSQCQLDDMTCDLTVGDKGGETMSPCTCTCGRDLNTNLKVNYNRNAANTTKWSPIIGQWAPKWRHRWAIWIVPAATYHHVPGGEVWVQFHLISSRSNLGLLPAVNYVRRKTFRLNPRLLCSSVNINLLWSLMLFVCDYRNISCRNSICFAVELFIYLETVNYIIEFYLFIL